LLLPRHTAPLGPDRIMRWFEARVGLDKRLNRAQHWTLTLASHIAYGAVGGMAFVPFAARHAHYTIHRGVTFGVVVWAVGYLGWMPALHIIPRPPHRSPYRRAILVSAHLVWGATLALLLAYLQQGPIREQQQTNDQPTPDYRHSDGYSDNRYLPDRRHWHTAALAAWPRR
ncbi:MAG: DUF1440 domain-containing protein, partial [Chloroflexaceae bacterium]|nr:DUF1440 domain-containing protein [Chloroflexaceae bacterium]